MKRVIREGVFETNSSSTNSITVLHKNDYDRWESDENLCLWEGKVVTKEEVIAEIKKEPGWGEKDIDWTDKENVEELLENRFLLTHEQWCDDRETCIEEFTTRSGDQIVAFASFGYG